MGRSAQMQRRGQGKGQGPGRRRAGSFVAIGLMAALPAAARAQFIDASAVTASMTSRQAVIPAGQPVWIDFVLHNPTEQATVLFLPDQEKLDLNAPEMGLPAEHVFGSQRGPWLSLMSNRGQSAGPPQLPALSINDSVAIRLAPSHGGLHSHEASGRHSRARRLTARRRAVAVSGSRLADRNGRARLYLAG